MLLCAISYALSAQEAGSSGLDEHGRHCVTDVYNRFVRFVGGGGVTGMAHIPYSNESGKECDYMNEFINVLVSC